MIKQVSSILKCRFKSELECQEHLAKVKKANKSTILDSGISSDGIGFYSWIKILEWKDERTTIEEIE